MYNDVLRAVNGMIGFYVFPVSVCYDPVLDPAALSARSRANHMIKKPHGVAFTGQARILPTQESEERSYVQPKGERTRPESWQGGACTRSYTWRSRRYRTVPQTVP